MTETNDKFTETHPWPPFIPQGAKILIMGTFPPKSNRWSMNFYYPNRINDFWRIMGRIFHDDKDFFWNPDLKAFDLESIKQMLREHHIALNDTGAEVRRLRDNASDKYLDIIRHVDLKSLLVRIPDCIAIATTGEKAAEVIAQLTDTVAPKMGQFVEWKNDEQKNIKIFRMPSTSRAYPLALEKKAEYYAEMFRIVGIL